MHLSLSRIYAAVLLAILLCCTQAQAASRRLNDSEINTLVQSYTSAGYEPGQLEKTFRDTRVRYVPKLVRMLVVPPDFSSNYERFTKQSAVDTARKFRRYWRTCLGRAADMHDVDPGVIVAILLVETSLGKNLGRSPVLSVFASLMLESSLYRETFIATLEDNARKAHYIKRLDDKATWAREELQALLAISKQKSIDVCALKGSYAGAFGIPQFLPSSYLKWAHSGTEKRAPNLFYMPHAIMSVANFLKEHGWKSGLTHEEKRAVIWNYNHSSTYVDTVLTVAEKLNKNSHHR